MKFTVDLALSSGGRLGQISHINRHKTIALETPMCTLFTKGGCAPYLSESMLNRIHDVPQIAAVSVNSMVEHFENVKASGHGLQGFIAMKDKLIFSSLHDASLSIPIGKNTKSSTSVWSKGGRTQIDPALYLKLQEAFQPHWCQALSDGDTDETSTSKRLAKAVDRTLDFLDDLVEMWPKSQALKNTSLIGVIEGGFSEEERKRSATETAARPVQGFLLEGFQKGPIGADVFKNDSFLPILSKTISYLPEDKPRFMDVAWSPLQVLQAFRQGVDIFSSSYPHTLTEKGLALATRFPPPAEQSTAKPPESSMCSAQTDLLMDLKEKRYFDDFSPIVEACGCYTCTTFTRSYVHHLLNTSELLAYVLLTIHNFHVYFDFFHVLREVARNDRLRDLEADLRIQTDRSAHLHEQL